MSPSTRGIIYIVTGQKFVEEACRSAAGVMRLCVDQWLQIYRADWEKTVDWLFPGGRFSTNHPFSAPSMKVA